MEKKQNILAKWWPELLLFSASILMFFWGLGDRALWAAEGRWACIVKEMFQSGDFLHPTINGTAYFDKPILTYWLILPFTFLTNGINEWSLRIPSAISGVIIVFCTYYLGRKFKSRKAGLIGAWIIMASYGIMFWARTGTAETENVAAIMMALAWYWYRREKPNFVTFLVFYLVCFLGALTKGLPAIVIPCLALIPDLVVEKRWKYLLTPAHISAGIVGVTVYIIPHVIATLTSTATYTDNAFVEVFRENIMRFADPFDHIEPWWVYFEYVPRLLMPWSVMFVASFIGLSRKFKKQNKEVQWLLLAFVLVFVFFSLSGSRRSYYILPAIPLCAIQIGIFFSAIYPSKSFNRVLQFIAIGFQSFLATILITASIVVPIAYYIPSVKAKVMEHSPIEPETGLMTATFMAGILSVFVILYTIKNRNIKSPLLRHVYFNIGIFTIFLGLFYCVITPMLDKYRPLKKFALTIKEKADKLPGDRIAIYPDTYENLVFYLDRGPDDHITILYTPEDEAFKKFIYSKERGIIMVKREFIENVQHFFPKVRTAPDFDVVENEELQSKRDFVGWGVNYGPR
ncbi:MAG: glycosyltransferase family 39 protein [Kiritimatiellae bacterium]|jgi:4-amino-4-deoxy-L-arabinose transferase-like glycosyltransferase|nr:glycosyltransferase family 39 protein [Kiritimatiellia bacterium]